MNLLQEVQEMTARKQKVPALKTGMTVRVHQKIKEGNKERVQVFEGLIIKINSGHSADKSFTVRKVVGGIGVEKIFPLYSPMIEKIEVKKEAKVRRAKLYYMRDRFGKSARLREKFVAEQVMDTSIAAEEEPVIEEAPVTDEAAATEQAETTESAPAEAATPEENTANEEATTTEEAPTEAAEKEAEKASAEEPTAKAEEAEAAEKDEAEEKSE